MCFLLLVVRALPFTGLALIAIGTGGIKPCVSAFGADQFNDEQVRDLIIVCIFWTGSGDTF